MTTHRIALWSQRMVKQMRLIKCHFPRISDACKHSNERWKCSTDLLGSSWKRQQHDGWSHLKWNWIFYYLMQLLSHILIIPFGAKGQGKEAENRQSTQKQFRNTTNAFYCQWKRPPPHPSAKENSVSSPIFFCFWEMKISSILEWNVFNLWEGTSVAWAWQNHSGLKEKEST